jgi:hypothetical protein
MASVLLLVAPEAEEVVEDVADTAEKEVLKEGE